MSTLSIHHRPAPFIAAAVAVTALAAGTVAVSVAQQSDQPTAPAGPSTSIHQVRPGLHDFQPTTSGGRVMLGQ